ncbi:MAG TPA: hypothetical protein VEM15_12830, partial [Thermodesulfobacteriota bacterium]|nr:hypothetical protein [Thermodesulfobacteriota bacterium]
MQFEKIVFPNRRDEQLAARLDPPQPVRGTGTPRLRTGEVIMAKRITEKGNWITMVALVLILLLAGTSLGSDGKEDLLSQAKGIFGPLPEAM